MIPIVGNTRAIEILQDFQKTSVCRMILDLETQLALQLAISALRGRVLADEDFVSGQRNAAGRPDHRPAASSI